MDRNIGRAVVDIQVQGALCVSLAKDIGIDDDDVGKHAVMNIAPECDDAVVLEGNRIVRIAFVE